MNQGWIYREKVTQQADGCSVLDYYANRYLHSSRSEWQMRIELGQILLDGKPTTSETCLKTGQKLAYHRPPWQEPDVPLNWLTIYEDNEVLVIEKPSGLPVLPGGGFLENTLVHQLQKHYPKATPLPIHRLGRGTSGLMLLARSREARAILSEQMRLHQIKKIYRTLAIGTNIPDSLTITQPIGKIPYPYLGYIYAATNEGLSAQSQCQVLQRRDSTTLLKVQITTGRPHQIRIHLAAAGYPLYGDPLYDVGGVPRPINQGKMPVPGDCGYHLHSQQLIFIHPSQDNLINLQSSPPTLLSNK